MFNIIEISDYVRVEPILFGFPVKEAIKKQLERSYANYIDEEMGAVIAVLEVMKVGEGILIPGDAAAYYDAVFKLLILKPVLQELVYGQVSQITNFGAFINLGALEAMIHISQTMEDYVSFSKTDSLVGKNTKRVLKKNDLCIARIVSISYKTTPPKIGLTMRQPGLGKIEWIAEDKRRAKMMSERAVREEKSKQSPAEKKGKKEKPNKK